VSSIEYETQRRGLSKKNIITTTMVMIETRKRGERERKENEGRWNE